MTETSSSAVDRPVAMALRSMLVLGVACTGFGLVFVIVYGFLNSFQRFQAWFIFIGTTLWLGPGVLFLICAHFMRRQRPAAAVFALATVAFQAAGAGILLAVTSTVDPISPIPIVLGVLWLIALADCARHLLRARRFLASGTERVRGFEMIAPKPVLPIGPDEPVL
jgi:hypothetical protein